MESGLADEPLFVTGWPGMIPYLSPDDRNGTFLIDAPISYDLGVPFNSTSKHFSVIITAKGGKEPLAEGKNIPVNSTGSALDFSFSGWDASSTPVEVECTATFDDGSTFFATSEVKYLPPNPYGGSTTKIDTKTGALVVKKNSGLWEPMIAFG